MQQVPVLILRHGETEWNRAGRMQGGLDSPLTEKGQAQAAQQASILSAHIDETWDWFSSPQRRARATAQIAGAGRDVVEDTRLREIAMGDWSGMLRSQIAQERPDLFQDTQRMDWYGQAPGGETLADLSDRVTRFLADLERPSVIVTHGITSRALRCELLGLPIERFHELGGGQGVAYHIDADRYDCLTPDGVVPQSRLLTENL